MPRLIQINVTANWGSTGKIAEDIGKLAIADGWESWIAYGRGNPQSESNLVRVGNDFDMRLHGLQSRLLDNHGLASKSATKKLTKRIREINPDIIHLHNIHGYFLNYPLLFDFLKEFEKPVVWTFHDCWPFTGHCAYYDFAKCDKWKTECHDCPQLKSYPTSLFRDNSSHNFFKKKQSFLGVKNMTLVPVSEWLNKEIGKSFLGDYPIKTIHNGIDLNVFTTGDVKKTDDSKKVILGVASVWDKRKGLNEFVKLRNILPKEYLIILVGLSQDQISSLPEGITGIRRTENVRQLADLYSMADVFVNPTLEDNFPTTNLEALACGTPVITYRTGGSPEAVDEKTGAVVACQDVQALAECIRHICETSVFSSDDCRKRAEWNYDKTNVFKEYLNLYNSLITK